MGRGSAVVGLGVMELGLGFEIFSASVSVRCVCLVIRPSAPGIASRLRTHNARETRWGAHDADDGTVEDAEEDAIESAAGSADGRQMQTMRDGDMVGLRTCHWWLDTGSREI